MLLKSTSYLSRSLLDDGIANVLCASLPRLFAPDRDIGWIVEGEDRSDATVIDLGESERLLNLLNEEKARSEANQKRLARAIGTVSPFMRTLGSIHLARQDEEIHLHFDKFPFSERAHMWKFGNSLTIRIFESSRSSLLGKLKELYDSCDFEYGYVCHPDQYRDSNISVDNGEKAVGLDFSRYLPGLYWGNFFSDRLCQLIGLTSSRQIEGHQLLRLKRGLFMCNLMSPDSWELPDFRRSATAARNCIGEEHFFDKEFPNRSGRLYDPSRFSQ